MTRTQPLAALVCLLLCASPAAARACDMVEPEVVELERMRAEVRAKAEAEGEALRRQTARRALDVAPWAVGAVSPALAGVGLGLALQGPAAELAVALRELEANVQAHDRELARMQQHPRGERRRMMCGTGLERPRSKKMTVAVLVGLGLLGSAAAAGWLLLRAS